MITLLLALGFYFCLFILLWLCILAGRYYGDTQRTNGHDKLGVVKIAEGTVFALLGLLIAFSFSGAYERFEERKVRIIDEVNSIETAYLRVGLLAPEIQPAIRERFRQYLDSRITLYNRLSDLNRPADELNAFMQLRTKLWQEALIAIKVTGNQAATLLFIPALNSMFEIAGSRLAITYIHPPLPVFTLLIGLAALCSFLVGYSLVRKKFYNYIFILSYVAITSFTIYIIFDLEFPRLGLIRVDAFDRMLVETRKSLE